MKKRFEVNLPRGSYAVTRNGTFDARNKLGSGVYFCRLSAGASTNIAKMILMK